MDASTLRGSLVGGTALVGARLFYPSDALYIGVDILGRALGGMLDKERSVFLGAAASASLGFAF